MLIYRVFILAFVPLCFSQSLDVTFKNVTFKGYSASIEIFAKVIPSGYSLKDYLPTSIFDTIEIKEQNIPVVYKDSLADLDNLDEVYMEFCNVEKIEPGALSNVSSLNILSFKGNKLKSIEFGIFNSLKITVVDLRLNQIKTIHAKAFDDMTKLSYIFLVGNNIQIWNPEWFKNTPALRTIFMQNNNIEELPAIAFKNMMSIKKNASLNITMSFKFSFNKIKNIHPQAFSGLDKIYNLWLDNNLLEEFNENLLNGIKIHHLKLNGNKIKCLEGDLNKILKANWIYIESNPFSCECLQTIEEWSQKNKNLYLFFSENECVASRIKDSSREETKKIKGEPTRQYKQIKTILKKLKEKYFNRNN